MLRAARTAPATLVAELERSAKIMKTKLLVWTITRETRLTTQSVARLDKKLKTITISRDDNPKLKPDFFQASVADGVYADFLDSGQFPANFPILIPENLFGSGK